MNREKESCWSKNYAPTYSLQGADHQGEANDEIALV
jgi:hypothetical protein